MPYTRAQNWVDGYDGRTPITAAALNHIEDGLVAATSTAESASTAGTAAQTKVDAVAATALVGGIAWTASWSAENGLVKTASEITAGTSIGANNGQFFTSYKNLPGNRTYRLNLVVSSDANTSLLAGVFYATTTGAYSRGDRKTITVPAGTTRGLFSIDVVVSYRSNEDRIRFIAKLSTAQVTIHLVTVEDITELVSAQTTANAAQTTANAAQTSAAAANTAVAALVTPTVYTWSHSADTLAAATVTNVPVGAPPSPITTSSGGFRLPTSCHGAVCMASVRQANAGNERRFVEVVNTGTDTVAVGGVNILARAGGYGEDRISLTWVGVPGGVYTLRQFKTTASNGETSVIFRVAVF